MPKNNRIDPRNNFVPRYLPWLLGGVMLVVYWATLNPWVTLLNVFQVATVSGWAWQPQIYNPLTFLVTLPFHLVPAAHLPAAMNFFSACCGAAALVVLARSVAILPHDRTEMERQREPSDFSFLTGWVAWAPPVAAVLFAGWQLAFWEHATSFSGESFELLWFAIILWQLLEYRLDEREARLYFTAFVYGAGLIENWALVGFIPVFLMAIIWLRRLDFFNLHFLARMIFWGLAGLLLVLVVVVPLMAKFSGAYPFDIWYAIKLNLRSDWLVVKQVGRTDIRHDLALMSLSSLLPAFVMSIRWSSGFGDSSKLGATLVNYLIHGVNVVMLGVLVWVTFDPAFSPRHLVRELGLNAPALSLYYIVALCLGYYLGYFLLVFGQAPLPTRRNPKPEEALPTKLLWLCPVVAAGAMAAVAIGAGLLLYRNAPLVRAVNDDTLLKFSQFTVENLPPEGAILLCDSDDPGQNQSIRGYLLRAELARAGRAQSFPVVDTHFLDWPPYHHYLHARFPKIWPETVTTNDVRLLAPLRILGLLNQFSKSNNLCYLNPSFGYYFEQFYQEPHGLVYFVKPLPESTLLPPALNTNLIAENGAFWRQVVGSSRPAIEQAQHPADLTQKAGFTGWFMRHLHVLPESNPNAFLAGEFYSRSLNFLGVQVQRAGELGQAAALFSDASVLNSNNVVADVNLAFNKTLRVGSPTVVELSRVGTDQFGKYRNWNEVLAANGPFDETSFCFEYGAWLMQAGLMRQAVAQFARVRQLVPDNLATRLFLASIYLTYRQPDPALEALHDPLTRPFRFALTEFNSTDLNVLAATAYFQKQEVAEGAALLEAEMNRHPDNETLLLISAQVFNRAGLYTNALRAIERKLARSPNDPTWLYGKGRVCLQMGAYDAAVTAFSRFLELQTNYPDAIFRRGVAYLQSDHLDAARADFRQLQTAHTNSFQVAYGLGEIAWRQHQTNEAIRNYHIYLAYAPTNAPELKTVHEHLTQLGGQ
jgi:tetratricopeptide (TPR) repeat protein